MNEISEVVSRARNILPSGSRSGTPTCHDQNAVTAANRTTMISTGASHPRPRSSAPAADGAARVCFSVLAGTITGPFFPAFGVAGQASHRPVGAWRTGVSPQCSRRVATTPAWSDG